MSLDCSPCYEGRPDFTPSAGSSLPQYSLTRSRLIAAGTFFRSNLQTGAPTDSQGADTNNIAIEVIASGVDEMTLIVYYNDIEVERYAVTQDDDCGDTSSENDGEGGVTVTTVGVNVAIPQLRTDTASSQYISMPSRGSDAGDPYVYGNGSSEPPTGPIDAACLPVTAKTSLSGGSGASSNAATLAAIKTGPDRTLIYLDSIEDADGAAIPTTAPNNLQEFNYDTRVWQNFTPDQDCRPEGTSC